MMGNPRAREAIKKEADGLVEKGTWDLGTVTERKDPVEHAKKSATQNRLGQLVFICSEKVAEMAEHLRVLKGRSFFAVTS